MSATVTLNGELCPLDVTSLSEYMAGRGYESGRKGVAVAVNGEVVPRSCWGSTTLKDGDRLEIVEPVQGG